MRQRIQDWIEQYRHMDWAVLYLRLFAGSMMLFHNVGKMQDYNELISSYPSLLSLSSAAVFIIVAVAEVVLSVLLMLGLWVRISAFLMALGVLLAVVWGGFTTLGILISWLGIYVFLVISGGGLYAFDKISSALRTEK